MNIIYLSTAEEIFKRIQSKKATNVYQVTTCRLKDMANLKKKLRMVEKNSVIWQHTHDYHMCAIFIRKGTGYNYNRDIYDLYCSGVNTLSKFRYRWKKLNHNLKKDYDGKIPQTSQSKSSNDRRNQESYIVAKQTLRTHVDRTHLIPVSVTGIECHRGILIDYDSHLNRGPMNEFEQTILKITMQQDIIWTATVFPSTKKEGLVLRYIIFNKEWEMLKKKDFIDSVNTYNWYVDSPESNNGN